MTKEVVKEAQVGSYIKYNSNTYLVVEAGLKKLRIVNPKLKGSNRNKVINTCSIAKVHQDWLATVLTHNGFPYLVTGKDNIVSLRTFKFMGWGKSSAQRRAILTKAVKLCKESVDIGCNASQGDLLC